MKLLYALLVACFLSAPASSQTPRTPKSPEPTTGDGSIRGVVLLPDGSPVAEAMRVTLKVLRGDQATTYTDQQGRFEFSHIAAGEYAIEVEADRDRNRFEIVNEKVIVRTNSPAFLTLTLKEKKIAKESTRDKTVSIAMLDQKVPPAAKHEFDNATRLAREGHLDESIAALHRALDIFPEYLMALNDLGAQLLEAGRLDEAVVPLRAAAKIDPNSFNPQLNLGIVLVRKKAFAEAVAVLDKALSAGPASPAAHLYAGMAASGAGDPARAEREFKSAADLGGREFSVALVYLGRIYMKQGERQNAIDSLERYLREDPDGPNAPVVRKMLADLSRK